MSEDGVTIIKWYCWKWRDPSWHAGVHYTMGSCFFLLGSVAGCFDAVYTTRSLYRWLYAYPFFVGSINFTIGATILLVLSGAHHPRRLKRAAMLLAMNQPVPEGHWEGDDDLPESPVAKGQTSQSGPMLGSDVNTALAHPDNGSHHEEQSRPDDATHGYQPNAWRRKVKTVTHFTGRYYRVSQTATVEPRSVHNAGECPSRTGLDRWRMVREHILADQFVHQVVEPYYEKMWRFDFIGSLCMFVGAIFYNVASLMGFYKAAFQEWPSFCTNEGLCEDLLEYWPNVIGSVLFIVGSIGFYRTAHNTFSPIVRRPFLITWWITIGNLFGSIGFLLGAAIVAPVGHIDGLASDWFEMFLGYALGSALFVLSSYLMIVELATFD